MSGIRTVIPDENLSVENGLANNYVKDITQDGKGFIWIATETGLSRFDGQTFTNYTIDNSQLNNDAINKLLYDPYDNLLWIGTRSALSIYDYSTQQITNFNPKPGIPVGNIVDLELAGDSAIWIVNHNHGIVHLNKQTRKLVHYSGKNIDGLRNTNWCVCDDKKGNLYIGHAQNGFTILDLVT